MVIEEIIKEKIRVELEKFKVYILVIVALTGGLYVLLISIEDYIFNNGLFIIGCIFLIGLVGGVIKINFNINNYFKKLENYIANV